jgi:hypothetical protein
MSIKFNKYGDITEIGGIPTDAEDYEGPIYSMLESNDVGKQFVSSFVAGITNTSIPCSKFVNAFYEKSLPGPEITPVGTVDPTNVSTGEANLINNNYTDLVYNNSSSGTTNKPLPGIDLGSSQLVSIIRVHWWTSNTYMATDYSIQGSNDGTNWTDVASGLSSTGMSGQAIDTVVNATYRYWRVFCVKGENGSWVTISEIEAFGTGSTIQESIINNDNISIICDTTTNTISIEVQSGSENLIINYNG